MISVKRPDVATVREALNKLGRDQLTERQRAIGHFLNGSPRKKPTFSAYKTAAVKAKLNELFHRKCAYCESEYESVAPMDVEHFRPKGAYMLPDGKLSKTGYYWLAAEWTNLLPSCINCNRERKQFRRKLDGKIVKSKSGKANKFPLLDETKRAKVPNGEKKELPVLLDPCIDNPALHLEFLDDGMVRPKKGTAERKLGKGKNSIAVYGLDRDDLYRERKKIMRLLFSQMNHICSYTLNVREAPQSVRQKEDLARAKKELKSYAFKNATYLGMVRPMIRVFNKVLKDAESYLDLRDQLNENPNNASIDLALEAQLHKLKAAAGDDKPAKNLVSELVNWMRLLG